MRCANPSGRIPYFLSFYPTCCHYTARVARGHTWYYMRMLGRVVYISAVTLLAIVFVMTGIVHDVIPHDHGHSSAESAIWQQLHSATRHDEKKMLLLPALLFFALLLSIYICARFFYRIENTTDDPHTGKYLRRGIAPYRRFT